MKVFRVINESMGFTNKSGIRNYNEVIITLREPPYEDENILNKTGWKAKDCKITDITPEDIE